VAVAVAMVGLVLVLLRPAGLDPGEGPADPTADPTPTANPSLDCDGFWVWVEATQRRRERLDEIKRAAVGRQSDAEAYRAWAAELDRLAGEQEASDPPSAAAEWNRLLTQHLQVAARWLRAVATGEAGEDGLLRELVVDIAVAEAQERLRTDAQCVESASPAAG
jgi:hypothetical protein